MGFDLLNCIDFKQLPLSTPCAQRKRVVFRWMVLFREHWQF